MTVENETAVTRDDEQSRYEIHVDGTLGGFSEFYVDARGRVVFTHTEIDPAFKGRGLGSTLVDEALADAARRGETVVPVCPFVVKRLKEKDVPGLVVAWRNEEDAQDSPSSDEPPA